MSQRYNIETEAQQTCRHNTLQRSTQNQVMLYFDKPGLMSYETKLQSPVALRQVSLLQFIRTLHIYNDVVGHKLEIFLCLICVVVARTVKDHP